MAARLQDLLRSPQLHLDLKESVTDSGDPFIDGFIEAGVDDLWLDSTLTAWSSDSDYRNLCDVLLEFFRTHSDDIAVAGRLFYGRDIYSQWDDWLLRLGRLVYQMSSGMKNTLWLDYLDDDSAQRLTKKAEAAMNRLSAAAGGLGIEFDLSDGALAVALPALRQTHLNLEEAVDPNDLVSQRLYVVTRDVKESDMLSGKLLQGSVLRYEEHRGRWWMFTAVSGRACDGHMKNLWCFNARILGKLGLEPIEIQGQLNLGEARQDIPIGSRWQWNGGVRRLGTCGDSWLLCNLTRLPSVAQQLHLDLEETNNASDDEFKPGQAFVFDLGRKSEIVIYNGTEEFRAKSGADIVVTGTTGDRVRARIRGIDGRWHEILWMNYNFRRFTKPNPDAMPQIQARLDIEESHGVQWIGIGDKLWTPDDLNLNGWTIDDNGNEINTRREVWAGEIAEVVEKHNDRYCLMFSGDFYITVDDLDIKALGLLLVKYKQLHLDLEESVDVPIPGLEYKWTGDARNTPDSPGWRTDVRGTHFYPRKFPVATVVSVSRDRITFTVCDSNGLKWTLKWNSEVFLDEMEPSAQQLHLDLEESQDRPPVVPLDRLAKYLGVDLPSAPRDVWPEFALWLCGELLKLKTSDDVRQAITGVRDLYHQWVQGDWPGRPAFRAAANAAAYAGVSKAAMAARLQDLLRSPQLHLDLEESQDVAAGSQRRVHTKLWVGSGTFGFEPGTVITIVESPSTFRYQAIITANTMPTNYSGFPYPHGKSMWGCDIELLLDCSDPIWKQGHLSLEEALVTPRKFDNGDRLDSWENDFLRRLKHGDVVVIAEPLAIPGLEGHFPAGARIKIMSRPDEITSQFGRREYFRLDIRSDMPAVHNVSGELGGNSFFINAYNLARAAVRPPMQAHFDFQESQCLQGGAVNESPDRVVVPPGSHGDSYEVLDWRDGDAWVFGQFYGVAMSYYRASAAHGHMAVAVSQGRFDKLVTEAPVAPQWLRMFRFCQHHIMKRTASSTGAVFRVVLAPSGRLWTHRNTISFWTSEGVSQDYVRRVAVVVSLASEEAVDPENLMVDLPTGLTMFKRLPKTAEMPEPLEITTAEIQAVIRKRHGDADSMTPREQMISMLLNHSHSGLTSDMVDTSESCYDNFNPPLLGVRSLDRWRRIRSGDIAVLGNPGCGGGLDRHAGEHVVLEDGPDDNDLCYVAPDEAKGIRPCCVLGPDDVDYVLRGDAVVWGSAPSHQFQLSLDESYFDDHPHLLGSRSLADWRSIKLGDRALVCGNTRTTTKIKGFVGQWVTVDSKPDTCDLVFVVPDGYDTSQGRPVADPLDIVTVVRGKTTVYGEGVMRQTHLILEGSQGVTVGSRVELLKSISLASVAWRNQSAEELDNEFKTHQCVSIHIKAGTWFHVICGSEILVCGIDWQWALCDVDGRRWAVCWDFNNSYFRPVQQQLRLDLNTNESFDPQSGNELRDVHGRLFADVVKPGDMAWWNPEFCQHPRVRSPQHPSKILDVDDGGDIDTHPHEAVGLLAPNDVLHSWANRVLRVTRGGETVWGPKGEFQTHLDLGESESSDDSIKRGSQRVVTQTFTVVTHDIDVLPLFPGEFLTVTNPDSLGRVEIMFWHNGVPEYARIHRRDFFEVTRKPKITQLRLGLDEAVVVGRRYIAAHNFTIPCGPDYGITKGTTFAVVETRGEAVLVEFQTPSGDAVRWWVPQLYVNGCAFADSQLHLDLSESQDRPPVVPLDDLAKHLGVDLPTNPKDVWPEFALWLCGELLKLKTSDDVRQAITGVRDLYHQWVQGDWPGRPAFRAAANAAAYAGVSKAAMAARLQDLLRSPQLHLDLEEAQGSESDHQWWLHVELGDNLVVTTEVFKRRGSFSWKPGDVVTVVGKHNTGPLTLYCVAKPGERYENFFLSDLLRFFEPQKPSLQLHLNLDEGVVESLELEVGDVFVLEDQAPFDSIGCVNTIHDIDDNGCYNTDYAALDVRNMKTLKVLRVYSDGLVLFEIRTAMGWSVFSVWDSDDLDYLIPAVPRQTHLDLEESQSGAPPGQIWRVRDRIVNISGHVAVNAGEILWVIERKGNGVCLCKASRAVIVKDGLGGTIYQPTPVSCWHFNDYEIERHCSCESAQLHLELEESRFDEGELRRTTRRLWTTRGAIPCDAIIRVVACWDQADLVEFVVVSGLPGVNALGLANYAHTTCMVTLREIEAATELVYPQPIRLDLEESMEFQEFQDLPLGTPLRVIRDIVVIRDEPGIPRGSIVTFHGTREISGLTHVRVFHDNCFYLLLPKTAMASLGRIEVQTHLNLEESRYQAGDELEVVEPLMAGNYVVPKGSIVTVVEEFHGILRLAVKTTPSPVLRRGKPCHTGLMLTWWFPPIVVDRCTRRYQRQMRLDLDEGLSHHTGVDLRVVSPLKTFLSATIPRDAVIRICRGTQGYHWVTVNVLSSPTPVINPVTQKPCPLVYGHGVLAADIESSTEPLANPDTQTRFDLEENHTGKTCAKNA